MVPSDPSRTGGTYKLVITDTKTKATSQIPQSIHDSHKIQLMLYRKLLDDLLSPKFGWIPYIESRKLEPCLVFSDEFKARIISLAGNDKLADRISQASCLLDLTFVWKATVDELQLAKIEVDKELSISYRLTTQSTGEFPM